MARQKNPPLEFNVGGKNDWVKSKRYERHSSGWYTVSFSDGTTALLPPSKVRQPQEEPVKP